MQRTNLKVDNYFSSSDDSDSRRRRKKNLPKLTVRVDGYSTSETVKSRSETESVKSKSTCRFKVVEASDYNRIPLNTAMRYINKNGKRIDGKYFKGINDDTILIGFYIHDKRNYSESVASIQEIFIDKNVSLLVDGGDQKRESEMKDTIEIDPSEWRNIARDTIISYQKKATNQWVYRAKFNVVIESKKKKTSYLSMTSEKGYGFTVNPSTIAKMYRHFSNNDKTISFLLHTLKQMEVRILALEKKQK